jgi:energy-coupling factor transporter ATP-binding protein EcfA2
MSEPTGVDGVDRVRARVDAFHNGAASVDPAERTAERAQNGAAEHRTSPPTPTGPEDAPHAADALPPKPRGPYGKGTYTDFGADPDPPPPRAHRPPALVDLIMRHANEPLVPLKLGGDELAVIRPGGIVAVMGPTGAGKSSLVAGVLVAHDGPTVVLSRELPADEFAARAIGMQKDASWLDVLTGKVPRHEMERVLMPRLYVLDRKDATLGALHGAIQAAQQEYPGQQVLVAIDYVQILESPEREARAKVADVLARIDDIARAYRVVVLAISQMSRASSRAARNGEALGADSTDGGAESAAIERFATMTLSIGASGPDREDGTRAVDLSIGKGRMTGGDRVLPMSYCGRTGRWRMAGDARRTEEVRAEREGQRNGAKQRTAELAMVAAADKATEPQKREDLAAVAACSKDVRRAAMTALLARGDLVEVACKSARSRAWKVWRPDKARAAGIRLADSEDE